MSDILCVTNRKLCKEDFLQRIERIAKAEPKGIILREKDLEPQEYKKLAEAVLLQCRQQGIVCILHNFTDVAMALECTAIHVPIPVLRTLKETEKKNFTILGTSCHSVEEAKEAEKLGCTYILAGHIFETDCKQGLSGRGVDFLRRVCESVDIPVYAIGGIDEKNVHLIRNAGAEGACVMSSIMTCREPKQYLAQLNRV
ncbi:MAG: thiamine phosphate synthase [Lachnospiraceae bacterium]|nr:thiamine phosphate synthase [Lachnospiraceae bacterium]